MVTDCVSVDIIVIAGVDGLVSYTVLYGKLLLVVIVLLILLITVILDDAAVVIETKKYYIYYNGNCYCTINIK